MTLDPISQAHLWAADLLETHIHRGGVPEAYVPHVKELIEDLTVVEEY